MSPGHVIGHSDYEEAVRHMKHCIYLALDEKKEGSPSTKARIACPDTDQLVGIE